MIITHAHGMDFPVASVDARDFALVRDDVGCARNCGTVFAPA